MKVLLLCLTAAVALVGHSALKERAPIVSMEELRARHSGLLKELSRLREKPPARPVHRHWSRIKRYAESLDGIDIRALPKAKTSKAYAHKVWIGKLQGAVLPVLIAAQNMQAIAPVYLDRMTIRDGRAELRLHVWGS